MESTQHPKPDGVTIVVPARDEEKGIGATLEALLAAMSESELPWEIIVVNDGSSDQTAAIAESMGARVLHHPESGGYGRSLKTGIRAASYEFIAMTDADGTYPADRLPEMLEELKRYDMVVGSRTGKYYYRMALLSPLRFLFLLLTSFVTGKRIPDPNSGLRTFRRTAVLPLLDQLPNAFSFTTTLTLIMTLDARFIRYIPVEYGKRFGRSKVRLVRDALRVGQTLVETTLRHNPLKMFIIAAMFPAVLTLGFIDAPPSRPEYELYALLSVLATLLVFSMGMLAVVIQGVRRRH